MDFFDYQDRARRNTTKLVVLFVVAVTLIILAVGTFTWFVTLVAFEGYNHRSADHVAAQYWTVALACLGTLGIIGLAQAYRTISLAGGGRAVAESVGGKLVFPNTTDPAERRLLNVVEEMAIASGIPVPAVYILEGERGINAFAAGYTPDNAAVAVTRGCLEMLSRDELQGVIGHEFSHILNGDMRLNIRLIGVIFGITAIGFIGYMGVRVGLDIARLRSRSRNSKNNTAGIGLAILLVGAGIWLIGSIGTLFGNLIRAAVSRQREYLADASSVQFTRNPGGLIGALKKIGGYSLHAHVQHAQAGELSHMFFGQAIQGGWANVFATHPPLEERIRRLDPSFDGEFPVLAAPAHAAPARSEASPAVAGLAAGASYRPAPTESVMDNLGQPTSAHVAYAGQMIAAIPQPLREATRDPFSARAVVLALLMDADPAIRRKQQDMVTDARLRELALNMQGTTVDLPPAGRLLLVDMALPALRQMSSSQGQDYLAQVQRLAQADERLSVFEWMLGQVLRRYLVFESAVGRSQSWYYSLKPMSEHLAVLLAMLAYTGHKNEVEARTAFAEGWKVLALPKMSPPAKSQCSLSALETGLNALAKLAPRLKRQVLLACQRCIQADAAVTPQEAELFRAVAATLAVPMPPVLPGQPLA